MLFFKQKTAYEMRISDWSSDVCASDLRSQGGPSRSARQTVRRRPGARTQQLQRHHHRRRATAAREAAEETLPPAHVQAHRRQNRHRLRSEERSVGKEYVSTCRSRGSPNHETKKTVKPCLR